MCHYGTYAYLQIPTAGVVPCCASLDCVSVIASEVADARIVWNTLFKIDDQEAFSKVSRPPWALSPRAVLQPQEKFTFAIPPRDSESRKLVTEEFNALFEAAVVLVKLIGGQLVDNVDYTVFEEAGRLLYEGSFVAERVSGVKEFYDSHPAPTEPGLKDALLPEIRAIYDAAAKKFSAVDAWSDRLKMMTSQRLAQVEYGKMNVLVVPTTPMHPTKAQYLADPLGLNHMLGKVRSPARSGLATCRTDVSTADLLVYALRQHPRPDGRLVSGWVHPRRDAIRYHNSWSKFLGRYGTRNFPTIRSCFCQAGGCRRERWWRQLTEICTFAM